MSMLTACAGSALRAAMIALAAAPVCLWLSRFLQAPDNFSVQKPGFFTRSRFAWTLLLVPFLTPDLLVGYAYGNFSGFPLVRHPWLCELIYGGLLWLKLVPVGTIVLCFSPPSPLSAEARHCRRLLFPVAAGIGNDQQLRWRKYAALSGDLLRGPARRMFPAIGLVYLLAFQEFELGGLLGISAGRVGSPVMWTRTLFDNQQGVIDRLAPLKWSLWPLLFDLAILVPLVWVAARSRKLAGATTTAGKPMGRASCGSAWLYFSAAVVFVTVLPLYFVIRESTIGFATLFGSREQLIGIFREILVGLAFAGIAGVAAYLLAAVPLPASTVLSAKGGFGRGFAGLTLVPGLAGSLIVGLCILYLFQTDALHPLYDTPVPLAIALVLFLAPRALLLQLLFRATQSREPAWLARLLSRSAEEQPRRTAGELLWKLERSRNFWAAALLALWAYWDLTSTSMLHPSTMVPASVRLYNLMHYGHNAVLSATTLAAVAVPLLFIWLAASVCRRAVRLTTL